MTLETPAVGMPTLPAAGTNRRSLAWMDDALCAQIGPAFWFAEDGSVYEGQRICSGCPARTECANHVAALEAETPGGRRYGVWAGLSGNARKQAESPVVGNPVRDARIVRLAGQGWDAVRISDEIGCEERTVYRVLARMREAS